MTARKMINDVFANIPVKLITNISLVQQCLIGEKR